MNNIETIKVMLDAAEAGKKAANVLAIYATKTGYDDLAIELMEENKFDRAIAVGRAAIADADHIRDATEMVGHGMVKNTPLMEGYRIGLHEMREACAKICDEIEADKWALYKGRKPYNGSESGRADMCTQGESLGAGDCATKIRKIEFTAPQNQYDLSNVIHLTHNKAQHIIKTRGYAVTGFVLTGTDDGGQALRNGRKCIVDMSAVRWFDDVLDFQRMMHPDASSPLLEQLQSANDAITTALQALGPVAPDCCGCAIEWQVAIDALQEVQPVKIPAFLRRAGSFGE